MEDLPNWIALGKFLGGLAGAVAFIVWFSWLFSQIEDQNHK